jgi:hypothetical protein
MMQVVVGSGQVTADDVNGEIMIFFLKILLIYSGFCFRVYGFCDD